MSSEDVFGAFVAAFACCMVGSAVYMITHDSPSERKEYDAAFTAAQHWQDYAKDHCDVTQAFYAAPAGGKGQFTGKELVCTDKVTYLVTSKVAACASSWDECRHIKVTDIPAVPNR